MRRTEVAEENFNVYANNSTAIVFITNEFFCVTLQAATAGLFNISSTFGYIPFRKEGTDFNRLPPVVKQ